MSRHDVIVVGIGLAGLTAAARLAQSGARVLVLAKGVGATHHSGATIDVLGYAPDRVEHPGEAVDALVSERPGHPYAAVGASGVAAALEWFQGQVAAGPLAPYAYSGGLEENLLLPTAVGAAKPTAAAPVTMTRGDLRDDAELCIVGLRGLKDFHATLAADNLARAGHRTRSVELDVTPPSGSRVDATPLAFARAFDDPGFRAEVAAQLVNRPTAAERLGFPAVLGIADPHAAWADLEHRCGRPVFEVPTLPPSVPGMRVFATLRDAVRRAGGKVILNAVVTGARATGGRIESLRAHIGLRETDFGAGWVVLATGGFAHGGLELSSRWTVRETALGLPVSGVPGPGEPRFRSDYLADQPMARAGVATDAELRPLDAGSQRVYDNVLVAGATLAGAEPWREKSGDGISLATGYRAAELIRPAPPAAAGPVHTGAEA
jgi:glycerol-3-phosphate dehydrogenase subunit B